jgi:oxalate decarboxylase family bicupin protein
VTYGTCRVTILDQDGRPQVADVNEGDLWYFPAGLPHSLQGLDPDGTEFVLAFDNGRSSEFNTLLVTDWIAHTPPEVLATNFGVPVEAFKNIPLHNKWIYQSNQPAPPLARASPKRGNGLLVVNRWVARGLSFLWPARLQGAEVGFSWALSFSVRGGQAWFSFV